LVILDEIHRVPAQFQTLRRVMAVELRMQRNGEGLLAAYVAASFKAQNLNAMAGQIVQGIAKIQMVLCLFLGAKAVIPTSGRTIIEPPFGAHVERDFQAAR